jgi:hypothetical protein
MMVVVDSSTKQFVALQQYEENTVACTWQHSTTVDSNNT